MARDKMLRILVVLVLKFVVYAAADMKIEKKYEYRNGAFITRVDYALPTDTLASFMVPGMISCNQKCLSYPDCVSYNYQVNKQIAPTLCELKSKGVQDETSDELKPRSGFIFVQTAYGQHSSQSCLDHLRNGASRSGVYRIQGNDEKIYPVYCDLESEPDSAWTLAMSQTFKNSGLSELHDVALADNSPLNNQWPRWDAYRLSLDEMKQIRSVSSHWRITCNFPTEPFQYTDYVRAKFADFDAISFLGRGTCERVELINVRGHECNRCTAAWWQSRSPYKYILHHDSSTNVCEFGSSPGYVYSEDNFGLYGTTNNKFRCTASESSSTNLWLGGYL